MQLIYCFISERCTENQFECYTGGCIVGQYQCDGYQDCDDQSDELNCDITTGI